MLEKTSRSSFPTDERLRSAMWKGMRGRGVGLLEEDRQPVEVANVLDDAVAGEGWSLRLVHRLGHVRLDGLGREVRVTKAALGEVRVHGRSEPSDRLLRLGLHVERVAEEHGHDQEREKEVFHGCSRIVSRLSSATPPALNFDRLRAQLFETELGAWKRREMQDIPTGDDSPRPTLFGRTAGPGA
jgi:hypothetical protein